MVIPRPLPPRPLSKNFWPSPRDTMPHHPLSQHVCGGSGAAQDEKTDIFSPPGSARDTSRRVPSDPRGPASRAQADSGDVAHLTEPESHETS